MSSEQSKRRMDATFVSFPSEYMPDMRTVPMTMTGEQKPFVNARYAYNPDRLLKRDAHKDAHGKAVPGTKALKESLANRDKKPIANRTQGIGSRGQHV